MMKYLHCILPVLWLMALLNACQPSSRCDDPQDVMINVGFYQVVNGMEKDSVLSSPVIYGIGREDSVLTAGMTSLQSVSLPPPPGLPGCRFALDYGGLSDTLTFSYTPEVHFISVECGFNEIYQDLWVTTTHHIIDSAVVTEPLVSNDEKENIKIYIH